MALLTWRILILLRVVARKYKTPKFTQEWFKTFALHTTLYVFMWVVQRLLLQLFQKQQRALLRITLPDLFPQNQQWLS